MKIFPSSGISTEENDDKDSAELAAERPLH